MFQIYFCKRGFFYRLNYLHGSSFSQTSARIRSLVDWRLQSGRTFMPSLVAPLSFLRLLSSCVHLKWLNINWDWNIFPDVFKERSGTRCYCGTNCAVEFRNSGRMVAIFKVWYRLRHTGLNPLQLYPIILPLAMFYLSSFRFSTYNFLCHLYFQFQSYLEWNPSSFRITTE